MEFLPEDCTARIVKLLNTQDKGVFDLREDSLGLGAPPPLDEMGLENQSLHRGHAGGDDGSLILVALLLMLTVPAAQLVNSSVPTAYMDEEFHLNQVQHYCRGDFSYWDPKITTLPGLYLASLAYVEILLPGADYFGYGNSLSDLCSRPAVLRSVNLVLFSICALLFREIALHLDPEKNTLRATMKALVLSLYPLHWFFTLLYYTEMGSAATVMAMYFYSLQHSYWISALFGVLAILFRQTNAVWVFFVLCVGVLEFLENVTLVRYHPDDDQLRKVNEGKGKEQDSALQEPMRDGLRKRRSATMNWKQPTLGSVTSEGARGGIILEIRDLIHRAWIHRTAVLWNFCPFLLVLLGFLGFVIKNGSVVVGDKEAHKVSPHLAQILYCGLVCAAFQATVHFNPRRIVDLLGTLKRKAADKPLFGLGVFVAIIFAAIAVSFYGDPHPYLLADNRHFTFYIWKDLVQRHWSFKYLIIPAYIYSWSSIISLLAERQKPLWILAFCLAVAGVLVPTPLLEFRYYNVPFYLIFLHMSTTDLGKSSSRLFLTSIQFLCLNYLTLYIFLKWTFQWPNQPGALQRFMW
ncbi:hypothetical protein R1sor_024180 [Riccia sorocarpa]|uniref:Dol-P-Glc:Glc(2)Man(9)GlcNAc(2)-PP-Dol alpha-1,2-glucosyltransferase n=1 Tax=Riccia sorocarpa TaxID=122646 RepID=A0ABD3GS45_9MARC